VLPAFLASLPAKTLLPIYEFERFLTNGMITFVVFNSKSLGILAQFVQTQSFGSSKAGFGWSSGQALLRESADN
jgi:hypothetical protein